MSIDRHCSHEGCHCKIPADRKDAYCSDYCKSHGAKAEHTQHACECKHGTCAS